MVAPKLITAEHPLYSVDGVFNAILVKGNMVGDVMFYGQGAGKLATASAVVSDVMDCARHQGINIDTLWEPEKLDLVPVDDVKNRFFVRVSGTPLENEAKVAAAFGKVTAVDAGYPDEYGFVTDDMTERAFAEAAERLGNVLGKIRFDS